MLAAAFATIALLPGLLTPTVADVKQQTPLPILAPDNFYSDFDELYPYGGGSEKEYSLGRRRGARLRRRERVLRGRLPRARRAGSRSGAARSRSPRAATAATSR